MARTLNFNHLANRFPDCDCDWKRNFETLCTWVLDKYGDDEELKTLIQSLGVPVQTITVVSQIDPENRRRVDCGGGNQIDCPKLKESEIKPCSVKLVKLELDNPDFANRSQIALQNTRKPKLQASRPKTIFVKKSFACKVCKKLFSDKSILERHIRIHTGEKPYCCEVCQKKFRQMAHLTRHLMIHTKEKPFHCRICGTKFRAKGNLQTHQRIHTGEKPYKCKHCSRTFSHSLTLRDHEHTHTGEKPYKCNQCTKVFTHNSTLAHHRKTHTGEKPHECLFCGKRFVTMSNLRLHLPTHTGEKQYECRTCGELYRYRIGLRRHEQKMH